MWSAGLSSALLSGSNPTMMPLTGFTSIYGDISKYISKSLKYVNTTANTYIFSASSIVSRLSSSSIGASTRVIGSLSGKTGSTIVDLTKSGFRMIYKVVEKALTTPQGFMLIMATYKLADYFTPPSPESVMKYLDDIAYNIENYNISIPEVSFPRVDLSGMAKSLDAWVNDVKRGMDEFSSRLVLPSYDEWINKFTISCGNPPAWHDLGGWINYGLCNLGVIHFKGFMSLAYGVAWLGVQILKILIEIGKILLDVVNFIGKILINIIQSVANVLLSIIEFLINGVLKILIWLANGLISVFIKIPATLFIRFILKPVVYVSITIMVFIKENLKRALCYLLKMYPMLSMSMGFAEGFEKKGIKGALKSGFARLIGYGLSISLLIPECSAFQIPQYQPNLMLEPVERVEEIAYESMKLPKYLTAISVMSLTISEIPIVYGSKMIKTYYIVNVKTVETLNARGSILYHASVSLSALPSESVSISVSRVVDGSMHMRINTAE